MNKQKLYILCLILLLPFLLKGQTTDKRLPGIYADFMTSKGRISVLLEYKKTPMTVANFIGLAEGSITNTSYPPGKPFFNGSIWHRVVKGHVIQGGEPAIIKNPAEYEGNSIGYVIPNEITDLSHNKAGMMGMANAGPHTNTCEYYITLSDRSYLDGNYTVFGEVVEGMDVVNKIEKGDTTLSIQIIRSGEEAKKFVVNNETFKMLVDDQWKKVRDEKELKDSRNEKYISDNYPGLIKASDGLRYKIVTKGNGNKPSAGSELKVIYSGKLLNGITFGSSSDGAKPVMNSAPEPFIYQSGKEGLIKGLQEILPDMKEGEKRILIIPPELGYGANTGYYGKDAFSNRRFVISPGETLIIELTLQKITR